MFSLGIWLARYYEWRATHSKGMRLWQILGLFFASGWGMILVASFGSSRAGVVYAVLVMMPVMHFLSAAADDLNTRWEERHANYQKSRKMKQLLKGFRK